MPFHPVYYVHVYNLTQWSLPGDQIPWVYKILPVIRTDLKQTPSVTEGLTIDMFVGTFLSGLVSVGHGDDRSVRFYVL